jgi:hypothetical protein
MTDAALAQTLTGAIIAAEMGGLVLSATDLACVGAALTALRSEDGLEGGIDAAYCAHLDALLVRVDAILAAWQRPN